MASLEWAPGRGGKLRRLFGAEGWKMSKAKMKVSGLTVGLLLALSGCLAAACGGSQTPAEAPAESSDEPAPSSEDTPEEGSEGAKKFDDMSAPEKMEHMKKVVAPTMAKVFQEHDPEEYKDFGCTS